MLTLIQYIFFLLHRLALPDQIKCTLGKQLVGTVHLNVPVNQVISWLECILVNNVSTCNRQMESYSLTVICILRYCSRE